MPNGRFLSKFNDKAKRVKSLESEMRYFYLKRKLMTAVITNKTAITIVALNMVFSEPRREWKAELKLSPKAPPRPAADC